MKSVQIVLKNSKDLIEPIQKLNTEREFRIKYRKIIEILILIQQNILSRFLGNLKINYFVLIF